MGKMEVFSLSFHIFYCSVQIRSYNIVYTFLEPAILLSQPPVGQDYRLGLQVCPITSCFFVSLPSLPGNWLLAHKDEGSRVNEQGFGGPWLWTESFWDQLQGDRSTLFVVNQELHSFGDRVGISRSKGIHWLKVKALRSLSSMGMHPGDLAACWMGLSSGERKL